jgi:hypothetical protein
MKMKRVIGLVTILLLSVPLAVPGAPPTDLKDFRLKRIDDPLRVEFPSSGSRLSKENIRNAIAAASEKQQWKIDKESDERMELTLEIRGKHNARIELKYSPAGYVIRYLDSDNLLYDPKALTVKGDPARVIHKIYNARIGELAAAINSGVRVSASVAVPGAAAATSVSKAAPAAEKGAAAPAAGTPASEGLPKVGALWKYSFRDQHLKHREQVFTIRVTGVDGWDVRESFVGPSGKLVATMLNARDTGFGARDGLQGYSLIELAPYLYSSELGRSALQSPASYPSAKSWKIGLPTIIEEQTQVPAGSFKTLRVEVTGTSNAFGVATNNFSQPARFQYTAWYAPQVKRYVMIRHQTWSRVGATVGDEIVKLVEYSAN